MRLSHNVGERYELTTNIFVNCHRFEIDVNNILNDNFLTFHYLYYELYYMFMNTNPLIA